MASGTHQRLTVRAGQARVAMAASGVAEIIRAPRITRMPHGPQGLIGVTHLRGAVLPVVSLSQLLGEAATDGRDPGGGICAEISQSAWRSTPSRR
jgi:chemotaxis signal transduction protein